MSKCEKFRYVGLAIVTSVAIAAIISLITSPTEFYTWMFFKPVLISMLLCGNITAQVLCGILGENKQERIISALTATTMSLLLSPLMAFCGYGFYYSFTPETELFQTLPNVHLPLSLLIVVFITSIFVVGCTLGKIDVYVTRKGV